MMNQETELKFIGPEDALARLQRAPGLARFAQGRRPQTRKLSATYFDTESFALRQAGFVLRVRTEGSGFVQTVKSANGPNVATRTEVKADVPEVAPDIDAIADKPLRRAVSEAVKGDALKPIFGVDVQRTTVLLTPKRGIEIEAAFDLGAIRSLNLPRAISVPICEFELELLKGKPSELIACARVLTRDVPLLLSLQSKAERGYALVRDEVDAPVTATRVRLADGCTADEAFAQIIANCLSHLLGNWPSIMGARDPEGIHQMRVALRRMRSAFVLFGGPFRSSLRELEQDLQSIAEVLGHARDLDVFQESVLRPAAEAHGEDERMLDLATLVRSRRRIAWHNVLEVLDSERFRRLAFELAAATFSRPWLDAIGGEAGQRPAGEFARERLAKRYKKVKKLGDQIATLDPTERHTLRKRLKRLRYAVDFLSSLFPKKRPKRYLKRLSALQDVLGAMNDAAMARALVRDILAEQDHGTGDAAYAGGVVAGWHLGHTPKLERELEKRWQNFAKLKPVWA